jgi:CMP-N-acetylneuraminic acid synthetase
MKKQKKDFKKVTVALLIGRKGSVGFPGKNTFRISGRALAEYPLLAAKKSNEVQKIFVSTDCPQIRKLAARYKAEWIPRPARLATKDALGEDAFEHGYRIVQAILAKEGKELEFLVLLFANAPTVTGAMIDCGIEALRKNMKADSAVSVSIYNMWSPIRARRLDSQGYLQPFAPFRTFRNYQKINCDRDSQGDVYFADMGVSVVRPRCLENLVHGLLPQKWMGRKILPIYSWGGCDIDYPWQIPQIQYWLKKNKLLN